MRSNLTAANRRQILAGAASAALAVHGLPARAQSEYPLRLFVGFPPGGAGDMFARILADAMREELARPIVVENKPGAGGLTVAIGFLRAPKDGNQAMLATGSTAVAAPVSRARAPYNPVQDFTWVSLLSNAPFVIAVNAALPIHSVPELVDYAKARPGKMSYGHAGLGTTVHLAGEMFKDRAGIDVVDIAYAGSGPAITDTIAGTVDYVIEATGTVAPHVKSGRLRIVGCMAEQREKIAPQVPTFRESGIDVVAGTYNLLALPLGTAPEVVARLSTVANHAMENPAVIERLAALGITPVADSTPARARAFVASEVARWSAVTRKLGIAL